MPQRPHFFDTRMTFEEFCAGQKENHSRTNELNAVALIRVDHFEGLRHSADKAEEERLLDEMTARLKSCLWDDTVAARFTEAGFLMAFHRLNSMNELYEKCRILQKRLCIADIGDGKPLTVSVGAAVCLHDPDHGYRCAYGLARIALEDAWRKGGNRVEVYRKTAA